MHKTRISIILITYNHESVIQDCISSLLEQSVDYELIVIDDASTDSTVEIIKNSDFKKMKIHVNKINNGIENLYKNYNQGLALVETEYVCILEGDDFWERTKLQEQLEYLQKRDVDVLAVEGIYHTQIPNIASKQTKMIRSQLDWQALDNVELTKFLLFKSNFFNVPSSGLLFKTKFLRDMGGFWQPENWKWLDKPTILKLLLRGARMGCVDKPLSYWRRHINSYTFRLDRKMDVHPTLYDLNLSQDFIAENNLRKIVCIARSYTRFRRTRKLKYLCILVKKSITMPGAVIKYAWLQII
jgi:glycosyltransferase involved in cell wall biosynthesis